MLEAPSKELADAALAAVRQWHYEPKRCPEGATPTEANSEPRPLCFLRRNRLYAFADS